MINQAYLTNAVIKQMKEAFASQGVLKLNDFFDNPFYLNFSQKLWKAESEHTEIPDKYSYNKINNGILRGLFSDESFFELLNKILGKKAKKVEINIRKFGHKNYTLLHDEEIIDRDTEFFFIISGKWEANWGGNKVYSSGEGEALVFLPEGNVFCLINSRNRQSFVKYINHHAGKESFILIEGKIKSI